MSTEGAAGASPQMGAGPVAAIATPVGGAAKSAAWPSSSARPVLGEEENQAEEEVGSDLIKHRLFLSAISFVLFTFTRSSKALLSPRSIISEAKKVKLS